MLLKTFRYIAPYESLFSSQNKPSKDKQECNFAKNILKDNSDLLQNLFLTSFL